MFVAAEFAFITVNRASIEAQANSGDRKAEGVVRALHRLSTQLSGAQVGITVTNLGIGFLAEPSIAEMLRDPLTSWGMPEGVVRTASTTLALLIATFLTMLFGELVPKNLAIAKPVATARAVQGFMRGFTTVMRGPIAFMNGTANRILGLFGIEAQEELASARAPDELGALVRHSAREGTLATDTAALLERSLVFGERRAHDVMTARRQMTVLDPENTVADLVDLARTSGFSRFPVIEELDETVDRVIGVGHLSRALAVPYAARSITPVTAVMSDPVIVPDTAPLDDLMDQLREGGLQMAVLIDEFGSIAGLVTLEDLVEELVGEVHDEHDNEEQPVSEADGSFVVNGLMRPDEVSEIVGLKLPEGEDYETLSGLMTVELGAFPQVGDIVQVVPVQPADDEPKRVVLEVIDVEDTRADHIRASVVDVTEDEEE
ncbi:DUF21 domain-containing protein [Epidermidibacterium keratini]|uniref:DUF21 domain-containing protein n=2 Tax=Epidermidibacterium keratini TaxID=1891644 RepID=A0A7L4YUP0_9ACTN|nr:DUF21 domain-containing protein [Epidermidibacterium keratini]